MGLFDHFKKSELSKARKEAEQSPNPVTIEAFCRAMMAQSDLDGALEQANRGLERFPDSDRLISVVKYVKKNQLGPKVAELKEKVRTNPSPLLYRQLAEIYRDIGDDQRALDTCMEVRERYPKDENTFLVMGEIFHERFRSAYLASDGQQAMENLQRACELNRNNYNALVKLSHLYVSVGLFTKAIPHLRAIINFAPADKKAKSMLSKAMELSAKESDDQDLDMLFRSVEERGSPYYITVDSTDGAVDVRAVHGGKADRKDSTNVAGEIDSFEIDMSIPAIVCFDRDMKTVGAQFLDSRVNKREAVDCIRVMVDAISKKAPALAMGSFRRGELETDTMGILVLTFSSGYLYFETHSDARPEQVDQRVGALIGRLTA